jgi:Uma2 family endonuclease
MMGDAELPHSVPEASIMAMPLPVYTTEDLRRFPHDGNRYELLEGMLIVTPAPGSAHQIVLARLNATLVPYLGSTGLALAVLPGEIEIAPKTLLDPDLLVIPTRYKPGTPWTQMTGWWLAVEVFSRSSKVYDRDFKRDAYLRLGVAEVWLVDLREKCVLLSRPEGPRDIRHAGTLVWEPKEMPAPMTLDVARLFDGMD